MAKDAAIKGSGEVEALEYGLSLRGKGYGEEVEILADIIEYGEANPDSEVNALLSEFAEETAVDKTSRNGIMERGKRNNDITEKIQSKEYSTKLSIQQYNKHIEGTTQYIQYLEGRISKGGNPQSILTISQEEAQEIISQKAGTGIVKVDKAGNPQPREKISCEKIIGKYYGNGKYHYTNKAIIHYSKKGAHIVPVKGDDYD